MYEIICCLRLFTVDKKSIFAHRFKYIKEKEKMNKYFYLFFTNILKGTSQNFMKGKS